MAQSQTAINDSSNEPSEPAIVVCGVQMDVAFCQPEKNLARIITQARSAAKQGARLVVFPECALTGYCFDSLEDARTGSLTADSNEIESLRQLSLELGIALMVGTAWRESDGTLRNAVLTIDRGQWIDTYFKVHLPFMGLDRYVLPGDRLHPPLDIDGVRVGIHICYEGGFPEVSRCLTLAGADLVVLPTNWPPGSGVSCRVIPSCRALENRIYFMAVNRIGTEGKFTFIGNSSWCQPSGAEVERLSGEHEGCLFARIDTAQSRRKHLVIEPGVYEVNRIADRHPELYAAVTQPH
ncbi:MAG: carbon-nitrogen hydrolase family protein [Planctomycetaceae bacterium]|nr:carbon-nitrogen hydrolase family protein [Planctomycetaceae bacterium]